MLNDLDGLDLDNLLVDPVWQQMISNQSIDHWTWAHTFQKMIFSVRKSLLSEATAEVQSSLVDDPWLWDSILVLHLSSVLSEPHQMRILRHEQLIIKLKLTALFRNTRIFIMRIFCILKELGNCKRTLLCWTFEKSKAKA